MFRCVLVCVACLTFFGCREDLETITPGTPKLPATVELTTTSIAGIVYAGDNDPAVGVEIKALSSVGVLAFTTSDAEGRWSFDNVALPTSGVRIEFNDEQGRRAERFFATAPTAKGYYAVHLLDVDFSQSFEKSESIVVDHSLVSIEIINPSFLLDGRAYLGEVNLIAAIDTTVALSLHKAPQPFTLSDDVMFVPTQVFNVQAFSAGGRPLQMSATTSISFGLPQAMAGGFFYHYQAETGQWGELATQQNGYEANAFGYFAYGSKTTSVNVVGKVLDATNAPVVGAEVYLLGRVNGNAQYESSYLLLTDGQGRFSFDVPASYEYLLVTNLNNCIPAYLPVDVTQGDVDVGDVSVVLTGELDKMIMGRIEECSGNSISSPAILSYYGQNYTGVYETDYVAVRPDGTFSFRLPKCLKGPFSLKVYTNEFGSSEVVDLNADDDLSLLRLEVCTANPRLMDASLAFSFENGETAFTTFSIAHFSRGISSFPLIIGNIIDDQYSAQYNLYYTANQQPNGGNQLTLRSRPSARYEVDLRNLTVGDAMENGDYVDLDWQLTDVEVVDRQTGERLIANTLDITITAAY